ncbi:MAG TPA: hypothetical protein VGN49_04405 [Micrococcaceae bacterium]|nr:hypothetical protein [Micrococcaceae bacterium]
MTDSTPEDGAPRGAGYRAPPLAASGPTASPWMRILKYCLAVTAAVLVAVAVISGIASGAHAALSAAIGWLVVVVFFGISLLVGHFAGRNASSGAIGVFMATYVVKVVCFGAILAFFALPGWMDPAWFLISAVATVVIWQGTEVYTFARTRVLIFHDGTGAGSGTGSTGGTRG